MILTHLVMFKFFTGAGTAVVAGTDLAIPIIMTGV